MKKILIFFVSMIVGNLAFCQTSLEDINKMLEKKNYSGAKTAIDKYVTDPTHATEGNAWYFKGFIYNAVSREASTPKADAYTYKLAAYDAFKKSQQLDRLDLMMKAEDYRSYPDLYYGFYNLGTEQYNERDYKGAYKSFMQASEIEKFILGKKYTYSDVKLPVFDTILVFYTGNAALQSGDSTSAVMNYRKIADAGIGGRDYESAYEFLAAYYFDRKDDANTQTLLSKAKAYYPGNKFWQQLELEKLTGSGDKNALLARYEELYRTEPGNFFNTYNYAVEIYKSLYEKGAKNPDSANKPRLTEILKTAIAADTTSNMEATGLMATHLYNWGAEYSSAAASIADTKPARPEDVKRRKDLNAMAIARFDETIPYAEKLVNYYSQKPALTGKQKVNYQLYLNFLSDIYLHKK